MKFLRATTLLLAALLLPTSAWAQEPRAQEPRAQEPQGPSVIYMIGDGMGLGQVTLGRRGAEKLGQDYHLDRFRSIGLASTRSASHLVTDSAAGGTALACGVKTDNKMIGQDPEGRRLETILEVAHRSGYATGVVTSTRITHATPASFTTHVAHRNSEHEIAGQLVAKASEGYPQVLIGGGAKYFTPEHLDSMRSAGYSVVLDPADLADAKGDRLTALLSSSHLPYAIDRSPEFPSLKDLTAKAVEVLEGKGPFFLLVEGGRIDHACHAHDAPALLHEQLDFDAAVGWALDLAARSNVLVVVTADHATGALAITEKTDVEGLLKASGSSEAMLRRAVAAATEAAARDGLTQHVEGSASPDLATLLERALPLLVADVLERHGRAIGAETLQLIARHSDDKYWLPLALGHSLSDGYKVGWYDPKFQREELTNTHGHDGADVGIFACGPGAERFQGMMENTEIPLRIAKIMGIPAPGSRVSTGQIHASLGALGE